MWETRYMTFSAHRQGPQVWADDTARRQRAHVPKAAEFATKIELALDLIDQARQWDVPFTPFAYSNAGRMAVLASGAFSLQTMRLRGDPCPVRI